MKAVDYSRWGPPDVLQLQEAGEPTSRENVTAEAFAELERGVHAALETYSNVHRGSGHNSMVSTHLYEQARDIVLEYLGLNKDKYVVIFCTPRRAEALKAQVKPESHTGVSSKDIGLPLGVGALAVDKKELPRGTPFQTGGGTARLVSPGWVIWAKAPDRLEAGTPAIVNVIAFAKALRLIRHFGPGAFHCATAEKLTATDIQCRDELEKYSGRELLDELRETLIGRGIRVPTVEGARPFINLDNAASTPTFTPIWNAVCRTWRQPRQVQQEIIHEVKSICAGVLGAPLAAYDVFFASNTTEAINLAAESLHNRCAEGYESEQGIKSVVLNTLLEHNSNELPWRMLPGFSLIRLPVDAEGFVDLNELQTLLCAYNQQRPARKTAHQAGGRERRVECPWRLQRSGGDQSNRSPLWGTLAGGCGIDYLAFSTHKVYAPFGAGVLLVRKGLLNFSPAELELIQSSGEENVGGVAALGKALVLLQRIGLDLIQEQEQALTRRALRGLAQIPGLEIYGIRDPDSPRFDQKGGVIVIVFGLKGIAPDRVVRELAERGGIGVRYGCHCAHLLKKRLLNISPLLERFPGLILTLFPQVSLPGVTRVSLVIENREEDVDTLIHVLGKIARQPRAGVDWHTASKHHGTSVLPLTDVQQQMNNFAIAASERVYTRPK